MKIAHRMTGAAALLALLGAAAGAQQPSDAPPPADTEDEASERLEDAQERLEAAAREIASISTELVARSLEGVLESVAEGGRRAMLGVSIGTPPEGVDGVEVLGVSPGGPADEAGIRAGDVLTSLAGQPLQCDEEKDRSSVGDLMSLMTQIEPGETVEVVYERDGIEYSTYVTTRPFSASAFSFTFSEDFDPERDLDFEGLAETLGELPRLLGRDPGPWSGMELVEMTPGLASYFDTNGGLLVVRAPERGLSLLDGDVVVGIGGATPGSPTDALRQLRFYKPGDTVVLEVVREGRPLSLSITIPDA